MRDLANLTHECPKWIVLDGDIDPMWIESLNTVMDDNKVLTLASNERISLTPSMRLLFEISHLKTATPATVSRAGILYINPGDLGWNPYVQYTAYTECIVYTTVASSVHLCVSCVYLVMLHMCCIIVTRWGGPGGTKA